MFVPVPPKASAARPASLDPQMEQDLRAFVGSNANYYLGQWSHQLIGQPGGTGFNKAGFFLPIPWLLYRNLYLPAFILFGLVVVEALVEKILLVHILEKPALTGLMTLLVALVVGLVVGSCGNGWYLSSAQRAIAEVKGYEDHLNVLARRGKTNLGAALVFFFLILVVVLVKP